MTGVLIALAAKGAQDVRLTYKPQKTFWKSCYKRYTNFAIETIEGVIQGQVRLGGTLVHTLQRNGDLASRTYLVLEFIKVSDLRTRRASPSGVPATDRAQAINDLGDNVRLINAVGFHAIDEIRVLIGGHEFDKMTNFDLRIMEDLCTDERRRLRQLIGDFDSDADGVAHTATVTNVAAPTETVRFYVPLYFWWSEWCRRDQSLPLIGLQYHTVQLQVRMKARADLIRWLYFQDPAGNRDVGYGSTDVASNPVSKTNIATTVGGGTLNDAFFLIDYVFLDTRERKAFSCKCLEYLITQTQQQTFSVAGSFTTASLVLNANHPVTYTSFFFQRTAARDNNDWDNWTGFAVPRAAVIAPIINPPVRDVDFITTATIQFNSQNLHQARQAVWWRLVEPGDHGAYRPDLFFYTFAYALCICDCSPCGTSKDPSGSINFSRIDNININVAADGTANANSTLNTNTAVVTANAADTNHAYVHHRNYNYAKAAAGMFGLYYAN
jgi:hypothetical protein